MNAAHGYSCRVPDDLSPAELRILVAVTEAGSFSAAGTRLGLTQSAISHAVRAAERRVGTTLFERGRTGARPTPAEQDWLPPATITERDLGPSAPTRTIGYVTTPALSHARTVRTLIRALRS